MDRLEFLSKRLATARKFIRERDAIYHRHKKQIVRFRSLGRPANQAESQDIELRNQQIIGDMLGFARIQISRDEKSRIILDCRAGGLSGLKSALCRIASMSGGNVLAEAAASFPEILSRCYFANPETKKPEFELGVFETLDRCSAVLALHLTLLEDHGVDGLLRILTPAPTQGKLS